MITFRHAESGDAAVIADMSGRMNFEDGHPVAHDLIGVVEELISNPELGQVQLIEINGWPVGFFALTYSFALEAGGREVCLDELYLFPEHRGLGYGKQAVEYAIELAREAGGKIMYLEAVDANTKAAAIYESYGFKTRGKIMYRHF